MVTGTSRMFGALRRGPRRAGDGEELVERYFPLQGERPDGVDPVRIAALDPFLRSLLFTDGTVTRALAVQMLAPVSVSLLSQAEVAVPADAAGYLEAEADEKSIRRRVGIGIDSTPLLWAESYLLADRLPPGFLGLLEGAADGIGHSLQRVALESYRELLWFGLDAQPEWAVAASTGGATMRRLYRIVSDGQAAILISESFAVERHAGVYRLAGLDASVPSSEAAVGGLR